LGNCNILYLVKVSVEDLPHTNYTKIMSGYYTDTHPKMEALQIKLLRETPPWRKMEMLVSLNAAARELALAGLRRRYPEAGPAELRRRLADLLLGEDLAQKVYGDPGYDR
jgi:hypothetical protein